LEDEFGEEVDDNLDEGVVVEEEIADLDLEAVEEADVEAVGAVLGEVEEEPGDAVGEGAAEGVVEGGVGEGVEGLPELVDFADLLAVGEVEELHLEEELGEVGLVVVLELAEL